MALIKPRLLHETDATLASISLTSLIVLAALVQIAGNGRLLSAGVLLFCIGLFWISKAAAKSHAFSRLGADVWLGIICCIAMLRVGIVIGIPVLAGQ